MTRQVPQLAIDFLKQVEACRLTAYQDTDGVWTIGYGDTDHVSEGEVITQQQADLSLAVDAQIAAERLESVTGEIVLTALSEHEYAALISFVFNLGAKPEWQIWRDLNNGKLDDVPVQIMRFDHGVVGGTLQVIPGLEHRRLAEKVLWSTGDTAAAVATVKAAPVPPPSSAVTRDHIETPPAPVAPRPFDMASFGVKATTLAAALGTTATQFQGVVQPQIASAPVLQHVAVVLSMVIVSCAAIGIIIHNAQDKRAKV